MSDLSFAMLEESLFVTSIWPSAVSMLMTYTCVHETRRFHYGPINKTKERDNKKPMALKKSSSHQMVRDANCVITGCNYGLVKHLQYTFK